MSIERARKYLDKFGMADKIIEPKMSSATVELAAQALGCEPARIAKTLSFMTNEGPILIVTAGDMKIDNKKYKAEFGLKAKMLSFDEVDKLIGHGVGGVCPFGINEGVRTYLDRSMERFDSVFPAAGSSNSAVEMTMQELEKYSQNFSGWIDVCKS